MNYRWFIRVIVIMCTKSLNCKTGLFTYKTPLTLVSKNLNLNMSLISAKLID